MTVTRDGVYKSRTGGHNEKLIQIRAGSATEYVRYVDEDTGVIEFVPVP